MRVRKTLSNGWQFSPDLNGPARLTPDSEPVVDGPWRPVDVPGMWQNQYQDLTRATGAGWYRLATHLDGDLFDHDRLSLRFGAVSHFCQGWLNDHYLGENDGGHLPFAWDVTHAARPGLNELLVRVVTPSGDTARYSRFPFDETLHGKQSWYGPTGGIWQPVEAEAHGATFVDHVAIDPDPSDDLVRVVVEANGAGAASAGAAVSVIDPEGAEVARADGRPGEPITVAVPGPVRRWSPDDPSRYRLAVELAVGDRVVDRVDRPFGFRTFEADDEGRFRLNGRPLLLRGVLDQDYYHTAGVVGPDAKARFVERFRQVKAMGFNTLRCHIKIPDPAYLDAADEVGLLVWCELPSTSRLTDRSRERIGHTLEGMIRRDHHHPSLVIWTVVNESWGFDLVANHDHRRLMGELYRWTKQADPDRLVVDNSPCDPNFHLSTDIDDYHFYALIPEMRADWDEFLDRFAARDGFTFGPPDEIERTGREPLVVSEFGTWGLPPLEWVDPDHEPWWFESGQEWARGAAYVHGFEQRFRLWHLDRVFGSWPELCRHTQRRQLESLRYQIDSMRLRSEIAGYVLTELSDVHWEANGLLDMAGNPRSFVDELPAVNASTRVLFEYRKPVAWAGDRVEVQVNIASGDEELPPGEVRWQVSIDDGPIQHGAIPVGAMGAGEVKPAGTVAVDAPEVAKPIECTLTADFVTDDRTSAGEAVSARSIHRLVVFPSSEPAVSDTPVAVRSPELGHRLQRLGYSTTPIDDLAGEQMNSRANGQPIRVVHLLTDDDHRFIRTGGRVLLLAERTDALGAGFADFPRIALDSWDDALHDGGRWISAFPWLARHGVFNNLPGGPMFDLVFDGLQPGVVITGIPPARFQHAVHAGVFVGWIHQVAALVAHHDVGLGRLLISTLTLTAAGPGADPAATWLLHRLIAAAG
jgi:hypothetical protein